MPIDIAAAAARVTDAYGNVDLAEVNDHVVRMSVMTEPFFWHRHPNSDEVFIVTEGTVLLETEDGSFELGPGHVHRVPAGVAHCTRPLTARTVNLTVEAADMATERVDRAV